MALYEIGLGAAATPPANSCCACSNTPSCLVSFPVIWSSIFLYPAATSALFLPGTNSASNSLTSCLYAGFLFIVMPAFSSFSTPSFTTASVALNLFDAAVRKSLSRLTAAFRKSSPMAVVGRSSPIVSRVPLAALIASSLSVVRYCVACPYGTWPFSAAAISAAAASRDSFSARCELAYNAAERFSASLATRAAVCAADSVTRCAASSPPNATFSAWRSPARNTPCAPVSISPPMPPNARPGFWLPWRSAINRVV